MGQLLQLLVVYGYGCKESPEAHRFHGLGKIYRRLFRETNLLPVKAHAHHPFGAGCGTEVSLLTFPREAGGRKILYSEEA